MLHKLNTLTTFFQLGRATSLTRKFIMLLYTFRFFSSALFCIGTLHGSAAFGAAEDCRDVNHYKHGITPAEGNVGTISSLSQDIEGDFTAIHDELRRAVLAATDAAYSLVDQDPGGPSARQQQSIKKKPVQIPREQEGGESSVGSPPAADLRSQDPGDLGNLPNFTSLAFTFYYQQPGTPEILMRHVPVLKKHVLLALEEELLTPSEKAEIVNMFSGGVRLGEEDIFTFISSPFGNAPKMTKSKPSEAVADWFKSKGLSSISKREKDCYQKFFMQSTGYQIGYQPPRGLDSERYAFWTLKHHRFTNSIVQTAAQGLPQGSFRQNFVQHLHTFRDMCTHCLKLQNIEVFLSNKVDVEPNGALVFLRNTLRASKMLPPVGQQGGVIESFLPQCTAVVSSSWRYAADQAASEKSKRINLGNLRVFNVNQYCYPEDELPHRLQEINSHTAESAAGSAAGSFTDFIQRLLLLKQQHFAAVGESNASATASSSLQLTAGELQMLPALKPQISASAGGAGSLSIPSEDD